MDDPQKDPNVISFMMQLVQEKHGDDISQDFLNQESDRLYLKFGNGLAGHFEPQLSEDQKVKFDELIKQGVAQDQLLNFLLENIGDLEEQIMNILIQFRLDYLNQGENSDQQQVNT